MQYPGYPYPEETSVSSFMYRVYGWMSFALVVTASVSYYLFRTQAFLAYLMSRPMLVFGVILLQFALVIAIAFFIKKMSYLAVMLVFVVYAMSMGVTMASIFFVYTQASIYTTFFITAGMFAITAIYGYVTKTDLSSLGNILFMALIGLILGGLVNLFLKSSGFQYLLSGIGVVVFTLLTAYDTQKLKQIASQVAMSSETRGKVAIWGALTLYLDFVNLFLYLLRFTGDRRD